MCILFDSVLDCPDDAIEAVVTTDEVLTAEVVVTATFLSFSPCLASLKVIRFLCQKPLPQLGVIHK